MKIRPALRFPRAAKLLLYSQLLLSLATGVGWYILNRWFQIEGEFGPEKHPWQRMLLILHGASAFLALIGFGALLASHLPVGWRARRNRGFGVLLLVDLVLQILTGYALYYAPEAWRELVGNIHLWCGLAFPLFLILHILWGHRARFRA